MLETNEAYMTQETLDGILSKTSTYNPSQKELNIKVLYDTYYIFLVGDLLMLILLVSTGQKIDKKYGHEKSISFKMSFIADAKGRRRLCRFYEALF